MLLSNKPVQARPRAHSITRGRIGTKDASSSPTDNFKTVFYIYKRSRFHRENMKSISVLSQFVKKKKKIVFLALAVRLTIMVSINVVYDGSVSSSNVFLRSSQPTQQRVKFDSDILKK